MTDTKNVPELRPRRAVLATAGTAGALAAVAAWLPGGKAEAPAPQAAAAVTPKTTAGKGYQLTDHVKQYYGTARI